MSFKNTNIKASKQNGFTIVELLIVIVVIAILAAITIVSYNGITARANTAKSQAAANSIAKKAEAYSADESTTGYPTTLSLLTASSASAKAYYMAPSGFTQVTTGTPSATSAGGSIWFYTCGATVGNRIDYWDAGASPAAIKSIYTGSANSGTTGCTLATT